MVETIWGVLGGGFMPQPQQHASFAKRGVGGGFMPQLQQRASFAKRGVGGGFMPQPQQCSFFAKRGVWGGVAITPHTVEGGVGGCKCTMQSDDALRQEDRLTGKNSS